MQDATDLEHQGIALLLEQLIALLGALLAQLEGGEGHTRREHGLALAAAGHSELVLGGRWKESKWHTPGTEAGKAEQWRLGSKCARL